MRMLNNPDWVPAKKTVFLLYIPKELDTNKALSVIQKNMKTGMLFETKTVASKAKHYTYEIFLRDE